MAPENPLLDDARTSLKSLEANRLQQIEADQLCSQTRLIYEELLEKHGTLRKDMGVRITYTIASVLILGLPIVGMSEVFARRQGVHFWERNDEIGWRTRLNGTEPEVPVFVVATGSQNLATAFYINVEVGGINPRIRYHKNYGEVYDVNKFTPYYIPPQRATLEEAQNWHRFALELQQRIS